SGTENTAVSITGSASDPDAETVTLSQTNTAAFLAGPASAGPVLAPSITLTGTPNFSQSGSSSVSWSAVDNGSPVQSSTATTAITIANLNQNPVIVAPATVSGTENTAVSITGSATDPDGDNVTLSQTNTAAFLAGAASAGPSLTPSITLTGTPSFSQAGSYTVDWSAVDATTGTATATTALTVANTDRAPALAAIANVIVGQGGSASRNVNASDPDGDVVEVSASLPPFATLNPPLSGAGSVATTISINPTPGTATGDYAASATATALGLTDTKSFTITVTPTNQVIQLDPIADVTLDEGFSSSVTVNATDADNDLITVTASLPGFAALLAPTSGTGTVTTAVTINPGFSDAGVYASSVTATDGIQPVTEPFQITVNNVDRPVALDPIADLNVAEGASASRSVNASDPDSDPITLSASLPAFASLSDNGNGTGSVTAAPGFTDAGSYPSSVTATANGTTNTETFTILVSDVDRAPVLAAISNINVQEGSSASTPVSATDADGETIGLTASLPAFATLDAPISGAGTVSTTVTAAPAPGDAGSYPSSVTATANLLTDTKNFTINVTRPNQVPTISAPATATVDEGQNLNFTVTAADGDSDPLTLAASGVPAGASFLDNGNGTGTFNWTPGFNQAGSYTVTFDVSDGKGGTNSASTGITVSNVNRCPTANAGGPYTGVVNFAVNFDGRGSSDPDGDPLSYTWTFGDGGTGTGATVSHVYVTGGVFTVNLAVGDNLCEDNAATTATIVTDFPANVFTTGGNNTTSLGAGKPTTCVQIEPIAGSFALSDVDLTTIKMISAGTGSVSEILAIADKTAVDGDKDRDGASEIRACFTKADLRLLFSGLPAGRNTVTVAIEGNLTTGGKFSGTLVHTVKSTGGALAAKVSPNPLNPETTLSFQLRTPGRVTVKIFDLNGRLVKTLLDDTRGAGIQDLTWNGTTDGGAKVASGVYYFRLDTPDGRFVKAATVLK
ncbi:MAG: Ig-like domain-containing protein, partial [Candidatus Eisenbacteria bacterium]